MAANLKATVRTLTHKEEIAVEARQNEPKVG